MVKNPFANAADVRDMNSILGSGRFPCRMAWQPTPVFLPGECHGQRSQACYSPRGRKESDSLAHMNPVHRTEIAAALAPRNTGRNAQIPKVLPWVTPKEAKGSINQEPKG